jgi:hypothetical protein
MLLWAHLLIIDFPYVHQGPLEARNYRLPVQIVGYYREFNDASSGFDLVTEESVSLKMVCAPALLATGARLQPPPTIRAPLSFEVTVTVCGRYQASEGLPAGAVRAVLGKGDAAQRRTTIQERRPARQRDRQALPMG